MKTSETSDIGKLKIGETQEVSLIHLSSFILEQCDLEPNLTNASYFRLQSLSGAHIATVEGKNQKFLITSISAETAEVTRLA